MRITCLWRVRGGFPVRRNDPTYDWAVLDKRSDPGVCIVYNLAFAIRIRQLSTTYFQISQWYRRISKGINGRQLRYSVIRLIPSDNQFTTNCSILAILCRFHPTIQVMRVPCRSAFESICSVLWLLIRLRWICSSSLEMSVVGWLRCCIVWRNSQLGFERFISLGCWWFELARCNLSTSFHIQRMSLGLACRTQLDEKDTAATSCLVSGCCFRQIHKPEVLHMHSNLTVVGLPMHIVS